MWLTSDMCVAVSFFGRKVGSKLRRCAAGMANPIGRKFPTNNSTCFPTVEKGATNSDACGCEDAPPLHLAVSEGRFNVAKFLLQNGANVNAINAKAATGP